MEKKRISKLAFRSHVYQARRGVTLIDLVVAISIVGIVAAAGGVRYASSLETYRLRQASRCIAVDIEAARHAARSRRQSIVVNFDVTSNSYATVGLTDLDHPSAAALVRLQDIAPSLAMTSAVFGSGASLTFNAFGVPDNGGYIVVSNGGTSATITVAPGTGSVTLP